MYLIISEAVLKNKRIENSTEKTIEYAIKNWLRHAKDRAKDRTNKADQQVE